MERIPFYNTAKQWRTLQKLALTSVDPSNTKFSFPSSLASLRQLQKALAFTYPTRAKARVGEQAVMLKSCTLIAQTCQHANMQKHATNMPNMPKVHAMPMLLQAFKLCSTLDQNTRTSKDESSRISDFPHRGERSPGQSPVGINYMQASGGQSLQLASCAHGRGLPCLPTVSYSLRSAGSQLALRNPGQQAGSPGSTAGRAARSDLLGVRRATVNSAALGRGFP